MPTFVGKGNNYICIGNNILLGEYQVEISKKEIKKSM